MSEDVKKAAGAKKAPLHLLPPAASEGICRVLDFGANHPDKNYGEWNWRLSGVEMRTYAAAIRRHLDAICEGEWDDPATVDPDTGEQLGSGLPHIAHIAATCAIIMDADKHGLLDRRVINPKSTKP